MHRYLKINQWWGNKISPLMAYVFLGVAHDPNQPSAPLLVGEVLLFLLVCFGIAGFGHLFLDGFDQREDRLNGKSNGWLSLGKLKASLVLCLLFMAAWLPLYFLPHRAAVQWLVALEFILFIIYAVPPLRFKERGLPGIIVDGLYGYGMPALVAWTIFAPEPQGLGGLIYLMVLLLWLLPKGIRHILRHQYYDLDGDDAAGVKTFAVRHGRTATLKVIQNYLLPLELAAMVLALIVLSWPSIVPLVGLLAFAGWEWRVLRQQWLQPVPPPRLWKPVEWSEWLGMRFLSTFTELLLPLLSLCVMLLRYPSLWPLSLVYLLMAGWPLKLWWDEVSPLVLRRFDGA
jgi:4-hydroxybenzoate polyprenyltransferase